MSLGLLPLHLYSANQLGTIFVLRELELESLLVLVASPIVAEDMGAHRRGAVGINAVGTVDVDAHRVVSPRCLVKQIFLRPVAVGHVVRQPSADFRLGMVENRAFA